MKIRKAVIPVAGLGTRFLPATKSVPKELLPVFDRPTIHYVVEEAYRAGIRQVIFVTASGKGAIEDYFDRSYGLECWLKEKGKIEQYEMIREISDMVEINSVRQKTALGLGHAVLCAKDQVGDEPFAVLLGDDLMDAETPAVGQLTRAFENCGAGVLGVYRVPEEETSRYGIIDPEPVEGRLFRVRSMVEKPSKNPPSNLAVVGRYVLPPEIFSCIERTPKGKGGEIQLTDALNLLNTQSGLFAWELEGVRYDAGDIFGFLTANIAYAMKRPEIADRLRRVFRDYLSD